MAALANRTPPGARFFCMNRQLFSALAVFSAVAATLNAAELTEVASFPAQQVTGISVSKSGRIFVNFPNWSDDHTISVAELVDGKPQPFPDAEWNKPGAPESHFVCVQSVVVDSADNLWILDPAAPRMKEIVKGGPKLIKVDLKTNQVVQNIPFGEDVTPKKSYLNDVRIDPDKGVAYMTESGQGAIIVVDLKSGKSRRLLDGHSSTAAEKDFKLMVDGRELRDESGNPPRINSDGIALDAQSGYLYYHALTGRALYRIKTDYLLDPKISKSDLEKKVEKIADTTPPDGMMEASDGSVYLTALDKNAIVRYDPTSSQLSDVIADKRLSWPDTLSWGPNRELYVTCSQIQNMPRFNKGTNIRTEPYRIFKVTGLP